MPLAYSSLPPSISCEMSVYKMSSGRVIWINNRYFLSCGINIYDNENKKTVIDWLISDFGVGTGEGGPSISMDAPEEKIHADRYGGSGGTFHGGSGRCGIRGGFNAKGIGRTPLASQEVGWAHSNGSYWLDEAIREAINSEVAAAECPMGAVPVIAILDSGEMTQDPRNKKIYRKAILVRPNFVRPAHFERSILFGDSGTASSQQYLDAVRVKEAIKVADANYTGDALNNSFLSSMMLCIAEQLGSSRAHRIWHGRFFSSNIAVNGAYVDFSSFRGLPGWHRSDGGHGHVFGEELTELSYTVVSLCHYFNKYGSKIPGHSYNPEVIIREIKTRIKESFRRHAISALNLSFNSSDVEISLGDLLYNQFELEQSFHIDLQIPKHLWKTSPSLHDALAVQSAPLSIKRNNNSALVRDVLSNEINRAPYSAHHALLSARRWLMPRMILYYNTAKIISQRVVRNLSDKNSFAEKQVNDYINLSLTNSRRIWHVMPYESVLLAQSVSIDSNMLIIFDYKSRNYFLILRAFAIGEEIMLFNKIYPREPFEKFCIGIDGYCSSYQIPWRYTSLYAEIAVDLGDFSLVLSRPGFVYREAAECLEISARN